MSEIDILLFVINFGIEEIVLVGVYVCVVFEVILNVDYVFVEDVSYFIFLVECKFWGVEILVNEGEFDLLCVDGGGWD